MTMAFVMYDLDATAAGFDRALTAREALSFCPGRLLEAPELQASSKIQQHVRRVEVSIPSIPSAAASSFLTKLKSTMRSTKAPSYRLNLTLRVLTFAIASEALLLRLSFRRAANSLTLRTTRLPSSRASPSESTTPRVLARSRRRPEPTLRSANKSSRTSSPAHLFCKSARPSQTGPLSSYRASPPTSNSFLHLPPRKRPKGEHRAYLQGSETNQRSLLFFFSRTRSTPGDDNVRQHPLQKFLRLVAKVRARGVERLLLS